MQVVGQPKAERPNGDHLTARYVFCIQSDHAEVPLVECGPLDNYSTGAPVDRTQAQYATRPIVNRYLVLGTEAKPYQIYDTQSHDYIKGPYWFGWVASLVAKWMNVIK